jgi:hypothetical protein
MLLGYGLVDGYRCAQPILRNIRRTRRSGPWPRCFCVGLYVLLLLRFFLLLCHPQVSQTPRSLNPVRRLSGGAVERGVWHGCQTRHVGPWMARLADPRNSAGARGVERSETRMPGALSLWLLSARVKRYGAKRSNSRRLARRVSAANQVTCRKGE